MWRTKRQDSTLFIAIVLVSGALAGTIHGMANLATLFIAIVLVSGALAGTIHGMANLVIVEPYLDEAIGIENQNLFASGEEEDTPEFWVEYDSYRDWQKGGQVLAGTILGTSIGALFGIVYALIQKSVATRKRHEERRLCWLQ